MFYACPKDASHQSVDSDYCSICGAKIAGAPTAPDPLKASVSAGTAPTPPPGPESVLCPDCGTPRRAGARFCEICRYNFDTNKSGSVPSAAASAPATKDSSSPADAMKVAGESASAQMTPGAPAASTRQDPQVPGAGKKGSDKPPIPDVNVQPPDLPAVPSASAPASQALPPEAAAAVQWEAIIRVDASLYVEPDPAVPCPTEEPERVFPIDLPDNLIGRRSPRKDIFPQIPLNDPGISHRHAKILRQTDGTLVLLDVGSTNGTELNGKEVQAGVRTPLQDGDQITLGCWTRIIVQSHQVNR